MTGFGPLLHAEWTKLRTVRGWVAGLLVAVGVTVLVGLAGPASSTLSCRSADGGQCSAARTPPTGPDGEAVSDRLYFVHRPLTGDGGITARVTSLTGSAAGVEPWAKAGVLVKRDTTQGSAYAAVLATGGHGVRMQYDYTRDVAGLPGRVSPDSPRWLRLTRSGDTLTGYDSADGIRWTRIGSARLPDLPRTVQIGLFATSPDHTVTTRGFAGLDVSGDATRVTGTFDHVSGGGTWTGTAVGGLSAGPGAGFRSAGTGLSVTGSGDVGPLVPARGVTAKRVEDGLIGVFAGLIAVIVVAAMFITTEYRRGLIRTTLGASPRRVRVLAAKAVVVGAAAFVTGLVAAAVTVPLVRNVERAKGLAALPVSTGTELRIVLGAAALVAVSAVLALAVGAVLRHGAGAVTVVVVALVLPYLLAVSSTVPDGVAGWLTRLTPAAAFAVLQSVPGYRQVTAVYDPANGYFPLPPWGGFAVLCGYAVVALVVAAVLLRRRDA